jgi:CARDB
MTGTIPALPAEVAATIEGDVSGQVIVGDHNLQLQVGAIHGGVINLAPPDERPTITARTAPVMLLPRRFPGLLDRHETVQAVAEAASTGAPVEIHGEPGIGKTVLLRHLAHEFRLAALGDGVVHLNAAGLSAADLLQSLYEAFYETSVPFKPTTTQIRLALQGKRALVLVDGPRFDGGGIEPLLDAAPDSVLVVTARERQLLGEGRSIVLPGLPAGDALVLIERELGRSLTGAERPHAERLCASLGYNPLRILRAAAQLREERRGFAALGELDQTASVGATQDERTLAALTAAEREVVELLAAVPGTALDVQHLAALAQQADANAVVRGLVDRRVVEGDPPRYRLAAGLAGAVARSSLPQVQTALLDYFTRRAESLRDQPEKLDADLDACMSLLESAAQARRWTEVLRLGRAIDPALTLARRWAAWERALRWVETAARALSDGGAEGWALHQLGTRALCLDEKDQAGSLLRRALDRRRSLHDVAGAAVTGHNLWFLDGLPPIDGPDGDDSDGGGDQSDAGGDGSGGAGHPNGGASWHLPKWLQQLATVGAGIALLGAANLIATHRQAPDGGGPVVTTTTNRPPPGVVGARPAALTFPDQAVGTTSPVRRVTLRNLGRAPLLVIDVRQDGPELADFEVDGGACMTQLAPGAGCEVTAAFIPRTAGVRSAGLRIEVNAAGGPLLVPLTGVAVDPGPGRLRLEPEFVLFGEQLVGTTSTPKEVVARNSGGRPVTLQYFKRDGLNPPDFAIDASRCPIQLAAGGTCPLAVTFTPTAAGARGASLAAVSDAADGNATAQLAGTGLGGGRGRLRADPRFLNFTAREDGTRSEPQSVTIANVGETPVTVSGVRRTGDHAADFVVDGNDCQGATLGAGRNCLIDVAFTPGGEGPRNAMLVVSSNGAEPETTIPLHGRPSDPVLEFLPGAVAFGERPIGKPTAPERLSIHNNGSVPVTLGGVEVLGQAAADFAVDRTACLGVLAPDQSCDLAVVFTPGAEGDRSARVVANSDPPRSPAEAALSGRGQQSVKRLTVTPEALSFEGPAGKTTEPKSVHVANAGDLPVSIGKLAVNTPVFAVRNQSCPAGPLQPGDFCEVEVTFTPAAPAMNYDGTLEVHSDAPLVAVALKGSSPKEQKGPEITVTPKSLPFHDKTENRSGQVKVASVGGKPATIGQVSVVPSGNFQVDPDLDRCSGRSLPPLAGCQLTVTFTPPTDSTTGGGDEPTVYEAVLKVPSDASSTPDVVTLTGTVEQLPKPERALRVKPRDLAFVGVAGSESLPKFVAVQSIGRKPVTITGAERRGGDPDAFPVDDTACRSTPLDPGETCMLPVTFKPGTANTAYATDLVVVADADGDKTVKLTGKSQEDQPDLIPAKTYQLSQKQHTVTITVANQGGAAAGRTTMLVEIPRHDSVTWDLPALPPKTSTKLRVPVPQECLDRCELTVTVDDAERVPEANERNNSWTYWIDAVAAQAARRNQVR